MPLGASRRRGIDKSGELPYEPPSRRFFCGSVFEN